MRVLLASGIPLELAVPVTLLGALYLLIFVYPHSPAILVDAIFVALVSVGLIIVWFAGIKCWRSFFEVYVVKPQGISVPGNAGAVMLTWESLQAARYCRLVQAIDLRFAG